MSQLKVNCRPPIQDLKPKQERNQGSRKWYWHRQWWKWQFNCGGGSGELRSNASTASVQSPVAAITPSAPSAAKQRTPLHKSGTEKGATPAAKPAQVPQPIVQPEPTQAIKPVQTPPQSGNGTKTCYCVSILFTPRTLCTRT